MLFVAVNALNYNGDIGGVDKRSKLCTEAINIRYIPLTRDVAMLSVLTLFARHARPLVLHVHGSIASFGPGQVFYFLFYRGWFESSLFLFPVFFLSPYKPDAICKWTVYRNLTPTGASRGAGT